jgi:hypothetical protein
MIPEPLDASSIPWAGWSFERRKGRAMKTSVRLVVTGLIAIAGALLPAGPAGASPEIDHAQIDETEIGVEDYCGLTVDIRSEGTVTTQLSERFQGEIHIVQTITNEANGRVVYVETSNHQTFEGPMPNPDGTFTSVVTYTGMNVRIYTNHSSVLLEVAGFVSVAVAVDEDDNVVDTDMVIRGLNDDGDSCEAILSAIG